MSGDLGKATLELDVTGFAQFEGKIEDAHGVADRLEDKLKGVAAVADVTGRLLGTVEISPGQAARSAGSVASILEGVHGVSDEARSAARELDDVHLSETEAAESRVAGESIVEILKDINRNANETNRALDRVALKGRAVRTTGVGVGAFGSGYGRIGLLGSAIGLAGLTGPAAAPALAGIAAGTVAYGATALAAVGTLVLALQGMGKAIGGDAKAYKELEPEQQQFVLTIRSLIPWLDKLKETAAEGLVPGLTQGLRDALSPGTVSVIQRSVGLISATLGQAAATWGAYLGSPEFQTIFGPLMVSGARNLGVMAVAALHLFDALGLLTRAGIPLVNWITDVIAHGSQLADQWLHAKDASGELAHGMDEAQTSLRLVGGLLLAAVRAVGALGIALYPVSKVAVKELTDGLNALAGWITRNEDTIRTLVGGALKELVAVLRIAGQVLDAFYKSMQKGLGNSAPIVAGILAIGAAILFAFGPEAVAITGAIFAAGEIIRHWTQVKQFFSSLGQFMVNVFSASWTAIKGIFDLGIYSVLIQLQLLTKGLEKALGWIPGIGGKIRSALQQVDGFIESFRQRGVAEMQAAGQQMGDAWGSAFAQSAATATAKVNAALDKATRQGGVVLRRGGLYVPPPEKTTKKANEPAAGTSTASVFGKPPPFDKNVPTAKTSRAAKDLEVPLVLQLRQAAADASGIEKRQKAAAAAIKAWAERMIRSGKLTTQQHIQALQLIAQENSVLGKSAQTAQFEVPLRLQLQEAKANASGVESKQRAAARAIRHWAQTMIESGRLTQQELIDAYNLIAQENSALAQKVNTAAKGANEAQFLQSLQAIIGSFAPNSQPQAEQSGGRSETHLYEAVHELRTQTRHLQRLAAAGDFAEIGFQNSSAYAAIG